MALLKRTFSELLDFTRATTATFVGSKGLIQTAAIDEPRFTHDPVTLEGQGLLIEEARTNLLSYPRRFDNAAYNQLGSTVTVNTIAAPDGSLTADTLSVASAGDNTRIRQILSGASVEGQTLTASLYVKKNTGEVITFDSYTNTGGQNKLTVNVENGTAITSLGTNGVSSSIKFVGDGWYRITLTWVSQVSGQDIVFRIWPYDNSGASTNESVYIWGAQLEEGSYTTSYIPTQGTQVTRAADVSASPQSTRDLVTYDLGDQAEDGNQIYKVVADPSTQVQPVVGAAASPPTWVMLGWSNQYRMFKDGRDSYSSRNESIDVALNMGAIITTIGAIGLQASSVTMTMVDSVDGTVYDETISLGGTGASDWWEYFFLQYDFDDTAVFSAIPAYPNADITLSIDGSAPSDEVRVGRIIIGAEQDLGVTNYGTSVSIIDYSTKDRDGFGNLILVPRRTVRLVDYKVTVPSLQVDFAIRALERISATPTLFIGDELYSSTITFGVYRDFSQGITTPSISDLTIQVEGF